MSLDVDIRHRLGGFDLAARFSASGGITALFGHSGSGKTSLVNIIAGLIRPDQGRVAIDDDVLVDTARRVWLPTHRRRIGYVFQEARLFPHLNVRQNLLFGRWFTRSSQRYGGLDEVVSLLGIAGLLHRRPASLSGGEKQRVAIGRALLRSPRLLLMDEPLASLDDERKAEILPYIERLRDEAAVPIIYVSHSVGEVTRLATTVVALAGGRMTASGSAIAVLNRLGAGPGDGFADEAGPSVVLDARIEASDLASGLTALQSPVGQLLVPLIGRPTGSAVRLRIHARDVIIALRRPDDLSAVNALPGTIRALDQAGTMVDATVSCQTGTLIARLTRHSVERLHLAPGLTVHAVIKGAVLEPAATALGD
jgi:molybdate transport system ATP-binding protein